MHSGRKESILILSFETKLVMNTFSLAIKSVLPFPYQVNFLTRYFMLIGFNAGNYFTGMWKNSKYTYKVKLFRLQKKKNKLPKEILKKKRK